MIKFSIPIKTVSPNRVRGNTRLAAIIHSARKKKERETARLCMTPWLGSSPPGKILCGRVIGTITARLTRVSAGKLDGDNLVASLKACRDGIAAALGVDDGSAAVRWEYAQAKCGRGQYWVEVEIT